MNPGQENRPHAAPMNIVAVQANRPLPANCIEQIPDPLIITENQAGKNGSRIVFINAAFTRLTGYEADDIVGHSPRILQGELSNCAVLDRLQEPGVAFRGQTVNYRKDGSAFDVEWEITPIRDTAGSVTHHLSLLRDLSERIRFEAQLRQAQKMESLGLLTGGIAHDFNNILGIVQASADLLLYSEKNLSEAARDEIGTIRLAAERGSNLTRQLLLFTRQQPAHFTATHLDQVIFDLSKMLMRLLGTTIELSLKLDAHGASMNADRGMLEQILLNLAVNSRDAMLEGGRIEVRTDVVSIHAAASSQNAQTRPGTFVRLTFIDTGCGIAPDCLAHVFEPFFTTKPVGKGTGLGLATVRSVMNQHRGWVEIDSALGRGTTFRLFFPVLAPVSAAAQGTSSTPQSAHRKTVLVVDDEPLVREITSTLLRRHGYHVLEAAHANAALELASKSDVSFDLIITDMIMPGGVTGRVLVKQLREKNPNLPSILTSGYLHNKEELQWCCENHVATLSKPYASEQLLGLVRQALSTSWRELAAV